MSRKPRTLLLAAGALVALVALVVSVLVSTDDDPRPSATPSSTPSPTTAPVRPLAEVDTLTTAVTRDTFCEQVPPDAVETALGAAPTTTTAYGDGESVQVTGRVRDIAHEFACAWTTPTAGVRAWVFAPPVTRGDARRLVRSAEGEDGCRRTAGAPAFGEPSVALTCRTSLGVQASYRGLFGDAWLTCTVADRGARTSAEGAAVAERAEQWCGAVLAAAATS